MEWKFIIQPPGRNLYSPPVRVPHWSSGGGIQTTQDFVHNGSYGVGGWMMNFDSIGGHRGFEGWWGMYVKKGAHYTQCWGSPLPSFQPWLTNQFCNWLSRYLLSISSGVIHSFSLGSPFKLSLVYSYFNSKLILITFSLGIPILMSDFHAPNWYVHFCQSLQQFFWSNTR